MDRTERRSPERGGDTEAWSSVRRDAWRIEAFRIQVAEAQALRRENTFMRHALMAGFALLLASWGYTQLHAFANGIAGAAHASEAQVTRSAA